MAIYTMSADDISEIPAMTFADAKVLERQDLQRLLRRRIDFIAPDTMILTEEYGDWEDSKRRIDLLGLGNDGRLVVIELKRTDDGGHMELQALRYAGMVSAMNFAQAVETHRKYLAKCQLQEDAEQSIRKFLGIEEGPVALSNKVSVVLAAADFSKEIMSTVLWLNTQGLDISCVRMRPHKLGEQILLDIQQIIPLPEAREYQIAIKIKADEAESASPSGRDYTKYRLHIGNVIQDSLNKRKLMLQLVREGIKLGVTPEQMCDAVPWPRPAMFLSSEGDTIAAKDVASSQGKQLVRFFSADDEIIRCNGKSYLFSNQWGSRTEEAAANILKLFPSDCGIDFEAIN